MLALLSAIPGIIGRKGGINLHLVLNTHQFWIAVIGAFVPLVGYAVNARALNLSEPVKAAIHVVLAAVAAALYTAIQTNVFGANTATAELVVTGIVAALAAHHMLWKPSLINALIKALFGGGNPSAVVQPNPSNPQV